MGSQPGLYKYEVPESAIVYRNCKKRVVKNNQLVKQAFETKSANARKMKESASQRASPLGLSRRVSGKSTLPGWIPSMNCSNPQLRTAASTVATSQLVPKQYLKQLKEIPSRVCSDRGEQTTAFGFPTIHKQDPETKAQIRTRAGCPGELAQGASGNVLTHTVQIENEQLVTRRNPLQHSLKSYT